MNILYKENKITEAMYLKFINHKDHDVIKTSKILLGIMVLSEIIKNIKN